MGGGALSSGNPWLITQAGKNSGLVPPHHLLARGGDFVRREAKLVESVGS